MSKQAFKRVRKSLNIEVCREPLPKFSTVGGYPIFYLCADGECLCADCVNKEIELIDVAKRDFDKQWQVDACDINWEDGSMYCAHCNNRIESAYAETTE